MPLSLLPLGTKAKSATAFSGKSARCSATPRCGWHPWPSPSWLWQVGNTPLQSHSSDFHDDEGALKSLCAASESQQPSALACSSATPQSPGTQLCCAKGERWERGRTCSPGGCRGAPFNPRLERLKVLASLAPRGSRVAYHSAANSSFSLATAPLSLALSQLLLKECGCYENLTPCLPGRLW